MYNTKDGCQKKGKCNYGHELIGKDACTAVLKYAEQKAAQNKNNPKAKAKTQAKKAANTAGPKNEPQEWRKDVPCKFFRASDPKACARGDKCPYSHKKSNE